MAMLPSLPVTLAMLTLSGLAAGPINPPMNTVLFERVPPDLRGRVFGAFKAGAWASIPLGVLLGGVVVGTIGIEATFFGIGLCYLVVTAYGSSTPRSAQWMASSLAPVNALDDTPVWANIPAKR
jgi:MFS family permease